jgi:hypothetical protein
MLLHVTRTAVNKVTGHSCSGPLIIRMTISEGKVASAHYYGISEADWKVSLSHSRHN